MRKAFSRIYLILIFAFLYAPLIVMVLISFNSGDSTNESSTLTNHSIAASINIHFVFLSVNSDVNVISIY